MVAGMRSSSGGPDTSTLDEDKRLWFHSEMNFAGASSKRETLLSRSRRIMGDKLSILDDRTASINKGQ